MRARVLMVFVCMGCEGTDEPVREDAGVRAPMREAGTSEQPDEEPGAERALDAGTRPDASVVDARVEPVQDARMAEQVDAHVEDPRDWKPHASWTCGMPEGIPEPGAAPLAFTARFSTRAAHEVGRTPVGQRHLRELGEGSVEGDALEATLLAGGFESSVTLANGAVELEQVVMLRARDGKYLYLRVCGTAPSEREPVRVVMDFEAPNNSDHAALQKAKLVGTRELDASGNVTLEVHDVASVKLGPTLQIENPPDAVDQTWACKEATRSAGEEQFRENVAIGSSLSVGQSKNGNRNVIPITGGRVTGRVTADVLAHGADFQLLGSRIVLDARYTLKGDGGALVLVRNCGPGSALIPVFEASVDGPYAFLNEDVWVSSTPGLGIGSVNIVISRQR
ncbi:MAG: DUF3237 family protein [Polyangiales bacterium]